MSTGLKRGEISQSEAVMATLVYSSEDLLASGNAKLVDRLIADPEKIQALADFVLGQHLQREQYQVKINKTLLERIEECGEEDLVFAIDEDLTETVSGKLELSDSVAESADDLMFEVLRAKDFSGAYVPCLKETIEYMQERQKEAKLEIATRYTVLFQVFEGHLMMTFRAKRYAKKMTITEWCVLSPSKMFDIMKTDKLKGASQVILLSYPAGLEPAYCCSCGDVRAADGRFYHQSQAVDYLSDLDIKTKTSFPPLFLERYPRWKIGNYFLNGDIDELYCPMCTKAEREGAAHSKQDRMIDE